SIQGLIQDFNSVEFANELKSLDNYELTEKQFIHLIGRCRMYKHMPEKNKENIPELGFGDNQVNAVCKAYYTNPDFKSYADGSINLWKLYNLFTGANKSTYIDNFTDRALNAYQLTQGIKYAIEN